VAKALAGREQDIGEREVDRLAPRQHPLELAGGKGLEQTIGC
jgi:hypothetical protein